MSVHTGIKKTYYATFAALLVLTAVTVAVAYVDLGVLSQPVALAIAFAKATLVVVFFMHLNHSSTLVRIFAGSGLAWLLIMLIYTVADYLTRPGLVP